MSGNVALDVFIGLIFVFLLYSLLATVVVELIASTLNLRGRMLQRAVRRMLEDDLDSSKHKILQLTLFAWVYDIVVSISRIFLPYREGENFIKAFYSHPSIKYLGKDKSAGKPSYISAANFSQAIVQLLRGRGYDGATMNETELIKSNLDQNKLNMSADTHQQMRALYADARQDTPRFKENLETWFNDTMDRCNGWYKRQIQVILLCLGLCVAYSFNVDAIAITKILANDKGVRDEMVKMATSKMDEYGHLTDSLRSYNTTTVTRVVKVNDTTTRIETDVQQSSKDSMLRDTYKRLQQDASKAQQILGLQRTEHYVIKKEYTAQMQQLDTLAAAATDSSQKKCILYTKGLLEKKGQVKVYTNPYQDPDWAWLGWVITALAISLGAPFWFDLLKKLVALRQSGPTPANNGNNSNNTASNTSTGNTTETPKNIVG